MPSYVICLDLKGKEMTSEEFSRKIEDISLKLIVVKLVLEKQLLSKYQRLSVLVIDLNLIQYEKASNLIFSVSQPKATYSKFSH